MKVLHVVPAVAPRYGGPSEAAIRMAAALSTEGAEILLATTDADGPGRLPVATGSVLDYRGVPTIFFPRLPGESLKLSPSLARWLRGNAGGFDLLHVHSVFSHASIAAGAAARDAGVPYIVRPLGQLDGWSLAQHALRKRAFLATVGRRLLRGAAVLHWTDESEQAAVPRLVRPGPGFVVPLGVDDALFQESAPSSRAKVILFLSRLHPKKNVEGLLEAFRDVGVVAAGWSLVIAGDGEDDYVQDLRTRVAAESRAGRVELAGWLGGDEKIRALKRAAVLVLPSRQENFGIAVAEAMAAGTPAIVTAAVALAGAIARARAGWVVPDGPTGLRDALAEAMLSEDERRRRGEAARDLAMRRFRWSAVAKAMMAEYDVVIRAARARS